MRDLSKARPGKHWLKISGRKIGQIFYGQRGAQYMALLVPHANTDGATWREVRDIKLKQLTGLARSYGEWLSEGKLAQTVAEELLDIVYAELNRRIIKAP